MTEKHQALRDALTKGASFIRYCRPDVHAERLQCLLADHDRMRAALEASRDLLKRTPRVTRDIYVGADRIAWGVQAEALLKRVREALQECGR